MHSNQLGYFSGLSHARQTRSLRNVQFCCLVNWFFNTIIGTFVKQHHLLQHYKMTYKYRRVQGSMIKWVMLGTNTFIKKIKFTRLHNFLQWPRYRRCFLRRMITKYRSAPSSSDGNLQDILYVAPPFTCLSLHSTYTLLITSVLPTPGASHAKERLWLFESSLPCADLESNSQNRPCSTKFQSRQCNKGIAEHQWI